MKNQLYLFMWSFVLSLFVGSLQAKDCLNAQIQKVENEAMWQMDISLENPNSQNYTAFQLDILLPKGFSVVEGSVELSSRMSDHAVSSAQIAPGNYRVMVYSMTNSAIAGNSGKVVSLMLQADANVAYGNYNVLIAPIYVSSRNGVEEEFPEVMATLEYADTDVKPTYTLVYWVDGKEYSRSSYKEGEKILPPVTPKKEGHTFKEWKGLPSVMPAHDLDVEAIFAINSYTLSYYHEDHLYDKQTYQFGAEIQAIQAPEKEGHTFQEWQGLPAVMPAHNVRVMSVYQVNSYVISYYLDNVFYTSQMWKYGEKVTPPEVVPAEGRLFSGWSGVPETMPAQDLFIYGTTEVDAVQSVAAERIVSVYTLQGVLVYDKVLYSSLRKLLPTGLYVIDGKVVSIKSIQ